MFEFLNKKKGGLELISGKTPQHFFKKHLSIFLKNTSAFFLED
jgi:hypothetical protein